MTSRDAKTLISAIREAGFRNVRTKDVDLINRIAPCVEAGEGLDTKETKAVIRAYRRAVL